MHSKTQYLTSSVRATWSWSPPCTQACRRRIWSGSWPTGKDCRRFSTASTGTSISHGLALYKIHHAAFDHQIIGLRPDYVLEVREDVLDEIDGPMLRHGLQELHGRSIVLPRNIEHRPGPAFVEQRYQAFRTR